MQPHRLAPAPPTRTRVLRTQQRSRSIAGPDRCQTRSAVRTRREHDRLPTAATRLRRPDRPGGACRSQRREMHPSIPATRARPPMRCCSGSGCGQRAPRYATMRPDYADADAATRPLHRGRLCGRWLRSLWLAVQSAQQVRRAGSPVGRPCQPRAHRRSCRTRAAGLEPDRARLKEHVVLGERGTETRQGHARRSVRRTVERVDHKSQRRAHIYEADLLRQNIHAVAASRLENGCFDQCIDLHRRRSIGARRDKRFEPRTIMRRRRRVERCDGRVSALGEDGMQRSAVHDRCVLKQTRMTGFLPGRDVMVNTAFDASGCEVWGGRHASFTQKPPNCYFARLVSNDTFPKEPECRDRRPSSEVQCPREERTRRTPDPRLHALSSP